MNDPIPNSSSDSGQDLKVIRRPLLAGICAAVCVFSSVVAFFFGIWMGLRGLIFDREFACRAEYVIAEYWKLIDYGIFFNLLVLSFAAFAGYLFTGALSKRTGIIPLLVAGFFALLSVITWIPALTGFRFLPSFANLALFDHAFIRDIPFFFWMILAIGVIPLFYLLGSIKAKTIPVWKSFVVVLAPFITFVFLLWGIFSHGLMAQGFASLLSWGMSFWIFFALVIFSELIRAKAKKFYVWLTLVLSAGAIVLSIIACSVFYFAIYQRAVQNKQAIQDAKNDPCSYYKNF